MGRKHTLEILTEAVRQSTSVAGVLRFLGIRQAGGTHSYISLRIKELGLDRSHFTGDSRGPNYVRTGGNPKLRPDQVFVRRSGNHRRTEAHVLRRALIEVGVSYRCVDCGLGEVWNGRVLMLQVDHLNRDWMDDRKENLAFRCPNCHTQTLGYAGSKTARVKADIITPTRFARSARRRYVPVSVEARKSRLKGTWPTKDGLAFMVWAKPAVQVAREIGVTSTMVKKKCKELGIATPPRGYWAQQKSQRSVA